MVKLTAPIHRTTDMLPYNHPNDRDLQNMLTIEVKINGRLIAKATATNDSDLADYSDYVVEAMEVASPVTGLEHFETGWRIECHRRKQSAWALVERIAAAMRLFQSEREA